MYDISLTCCTKNLCTYLLSLLESYHYDTDWIRYIWLNVLLSDSWCVYKALEVINRERYHIPINDCEQYHISYIERRN